MATITKSSNVDVPLISVSELAGLTLRRNVDTQSISVAESGEILTPEAVGCALLYDASSGYTDYTDDANDDGANDVPLLPSPIGANDGFLIGSGEQFSYVLFNIGTAGVGTYTTITWYYWNGSAWTALTTLWKSNQATNFKTAGLGSMNFDKPVDWALSTISGFDGYWLYAKYISGTVTTQPLATRIWIGEYAPLAQLLDLADSIAIVESTAKIVIKTKAEALSLIDQFTTGAGLSLSDSLKIYDYKIIQAKQSRTDTIRLSDVLSTGWSLIMSLADRLGIVDATSKIIHTVLGSTIPIVDRTYKYIRTTADDIINLVDSTNSLVTVPKSDGINVVDALSILADKGITDNLTVADVLSTLSASGLNDSVSLTDSLLKRVNAQVTDLVALVDATIKETRVSLSELIAIMDFLTSLNLHIALALNDTIKLSDGTTKTVIIERDEILAIADALASLTGISRSELLNISDVISLYLLIKFFLDGLQVYPKYTIDNMSIRRYIENLIVKPKYKITNVRLLHTPFFS